MKRKLLSLLIVMVMGMSLLVGCGGNSNENKDNDTLQNIDNVQESTTVENSEIEEKEEIDTSIYSEKIELTTGEGKVVSIYYDPTSVTNLSGADWTGKEEINLGEMMSIYVTDAESAKAYVDTIIDDNGGNIGIGKQEEIQLSGYTIHYFTLNEPESGAFLDKIWLIELDSDVVCRFMVTGEVAEGSQLEKELEAIKFVVGDENDTESNQNDNKEVAIEENLQTHEFPAEIYLDDNETGILTYNGDFVKFTEGDDRFSSFDLTIKSGGSYTFGVTLHCQSNSDAETYYQDRLGNLSEYDVSELKETVINDIPVKYFTYVQKTDSDSNKFLNCMIDFPDDGYKSRVVILDMFLMLEEDVMLAGLENFLVDIEIEGVKSGVETEDAAGENEWPVFLPKRPVAFEILEVTVDQDSNATHYSIDVGLVDYQTVKDYVDEIKNAGCDLGNGHEKYSEESGYIAFEGVLDNHIITVYYDVEWNVFEIIIGEQLRMRLFI